MTSTESVADRAAAAARWQAAREAAHAWSQGQAELRSDQRVEEAKASGAARPRPQDRAAEAPPPRTRPDGQVQLVDVIT
jgi:hypothetical protein